jgi:hypothetical protein
MRVLRAASMLKIRVSQMLNEYNTMIINATVLMSLKRKTNVKEFERMHE